MTPSPTPDPDFADLTDGFADSLLDLSDAWAKLTLDEQEAYAKRFEERSDGEVKSDGN